MKVIRKRNRRHMKAEPITILMAEDDPDDRFLAQEALEEARLANDLDRKSVV